MPTEERARNEEGQHQRTGPEGEQVLRAEELSERAGEEATDDAAEDPAGREQWEQPFGLTRVAHDRRDAPREHALQQALDIHE